MLRVRLAGMARAQRRRARRVGVVRGEWVELTVEDYRYVLRTGLGDRVEAGLNAIGVGRVVKWVAPGCGCEGRRERLNRWWGRVVKRVLRRG